VVWNAHSYSGTYALYKSYISSFTHLEDHLLIKMKIKTQLNESGSHATLRGVTGERVAPYSVVLLSQPRYI
jgi:hypothetical protein